MLKISRGILLLMLVNICLIFGCATSNNSTTINNFHVVVFSDVHFNPFYDTTIFDSLVAADASQWESIFASSSISEPSIWGEDSNYPLFALALSSIKSNLTSSSVLASVRPEKWFFTGTRTN